jgi:hypothetical protein
MQANFAASLRSFPREFPPRDNPTPPFVRPDLASNIASAPFSIGAESVFETWKAQQGELDFARARIRGGSIHRSHDPITIANS